MQRFLLACLCCLAFACNAPEKLGTTLPSGNGQTTAAKSISVVIASDQTVPTTATLAASPDAGLATSALQTTGNTSLSTIAASAAGSKTAGQATMANSVPVAIASNQSNVPVALQPNSSPTDLGQNLSLSDTAAHTFASAAASIGVMLSAPLANTVASYCSLSSSVTTSTGLELQPGDREFLPVSNANKISCITSTATQNVHAVAF